MSCCQLGGQLVDLVGTEADPVVARVVAFHDDDRGLQVAKVLDGGQGLLIGADVEDLERDPLGREGPVGRGALHARWLAVDGDGHVFISSRSSEGTRCAVDLKGDS